MRAHYLVEHFASPKPCDVVGTYFVKRAKLITIVLVVCVLSAPHALYWYGLNLVVSKPIPTKSVNTSSSRLLDLWEEYGGSGTPSLTAVGPWGYLRYTYCALKEDTSESARHCDALFPGIRHAAFAVRWQTAKALKNHRSRLWQLAWMCQTILASKEWTIQEVLETLAANETLRDQLKDENE